MIGPGWLPSRPRPLGRVRRSLLLPPVRRPRRRPAAARTAPQAGADSAARGCHPIGMLFDGVPAELPTATLLPGAAHARHRVLGGQLRQWLAVRWAWLRPRTVPMLVAFAGMLAVLGSTKYLSSFALGTPGRGAWNGAWNGAWMERDLERPARGHTCRHHRGGAPGVLHIAPARSGGHDVKITLEP